MKLVFIAAFVQLCFGLDMPIKIDLSKPAAIVDNNFLSLTLDSGALKHDFKHIDLGSKKLLSLAKGLTGHENRAEFYFRIGGTAADHIEFEPTMYRFNATEFDELCKFSYDVRWKLIFDLNSLERKPDGSWDPTNAVELINYIIEKGYFVQFELGNEPDLYPRHLNITIPPEQLAKDFYLLRLILNEKTRNQAMLVGPDVATLNRYDYFGKFLSSVRENVLDAVTFHHYYSSSNNITTKNFTSVTYLDSFLGYCREALSIIKSSFTKFPAPPVWIGETSSTYGGGSRQVGESFASGFVWLDKLGIAAQMNISIVMRQSLKGGHYSLLDSHYNPNPDYWSSLLYKQLMGRTVLKVTGYLKSGREVRVYAHCVNRFSGRGYQPGSVILMALNINPTEDARIYLQEDFKSFNADQYLFTPANGSLTDNSVKLNGHVLKMINDTVVPDLDPVRVKQPFILPALSYGYFVVIGSYASACNIV